MKKIISFLISASLCLSFLGCSKTEEVVEFNPSEVFTKYEETVPQDERPMQLDLDDEMLGQLYGIDDTLVESYAGKLPMLMTNAEEYFIAKVKDGKMEEVKTKILDRQKALEEQWKMYLPEQFDLVQDYKLVENGDYIAFAVGFNADKVIEEFEAKF